MPGMPGNITKGPILKNFEDFANDPNALGSGRRGAELMLEFYETHASITQWIDEAVQGGPNKWGILRNVNDRAAGAPPEHDRDHIRRHWFGFKAAGNPKPRNVWWPELHPMDLVFKQGLKEALRRCLYRTGEETSGVVDFDNGLGEIRRNDGANWNLAAGDSLWVWGSANGNGGLKTVAAPTNTGAVRINEPVQPEVSSPAIVYLPRRPALAVDTYWVCAGSHYELITTESDQQITLLIFTPSPRFSRTQGLFQAGNVPTPADFDPIWVTKQGGGANVGEEPIQVPGGDENGVHTVQLKIQDLTEPYDDF